MPFHEFQIIGRHVPTERDANPKIYRMRIFARSAIHARSRFWYFLSTFKKVKKATGEILSCNEIFEKRPNQVKNFGVAARYASRTLEHNLYKEYRDTSRVGAITQFYHNMAGSYRARFRNIQILSVDQIAASQTRRANTKQFHNNTIRFPLPHRVLKAPHRKFKATFKASRPSTHI